MKQLTIQIPDQIELSDNEALLMLATKLYEQGRLTLGQAATVAGYSKRAFIEILGQYSVSLFNYSPDELEHDLANAKKYHS